VVENAVPSAFPSGASPSGGDDTPTPRDRILVLGASGYLGRQIVAEYVRRGHPVRVLVRPATRLPAETQTAQEIVRGEITRPDTLPPLFQGVHTVVSALGLTRQKDGLTPWDVDYQGNRHALDLAVAHGVRRFAYVHVLNAEALPGVPLAEAKAAFVHDLQVAPLASTVICPSGYFSDAEELLAMARRGVVPLVGDGAKRVSFIDARDLAPVIADAVADGTDWIDVGGPEALSANEAVRLAFAALGKRPRLLHLPVWVAEAMVGLARWLAPPTVFGPLLFFVRSARLDMAAPPYGTRRLGDHFKAVVDRDAG